MGDVVDLNVVTRLDIDPIKVIDGAAKYNLKSVVILGYTEARDEYFASSIADGADVVWLLERSKHKLMAITDQNQC